MHLLIAFFLSHQKSYLRNDGRFSHKMVQDLIIWHFWLCPYCILPGTKPPDSDSKRGAENQEGLGCQGTDWCNLSLVLAVQEWALITGKIKAKRKKKIVLDQMVFLSRTIKKSKTKLRKRAHSSLEIIFISLKDCIIPCYGNAVWRTRSSWWHWNIRGKNCIWRKKGEREKLLSWDQLLFDHSSKPQALLEYGCIMIYPT